jgi:ABC-2 type transport system permease protein
MKKFYTLLAREVRGYFHSPIAYVVLVFFLFISGVNFVGFVVPHMNQRTLDVSAEFLFFNWFLFWIPFIVIFPLITMRLFAEEFRQGTIEPLMTAPVRDLQVVLAKFCGAFVFYIVLWLPTLLYWPILQKITNQAAPGSVGQFWGPYLILLLLGMFYIAIGCFTSVLTSNQIIAAVISFVAITLLFLVGLIQYVLLDVSGGARDWLGYVSAIEHIGTYSRGIFDTRPVVLYLSMTVLVLTITYQAFQSRKWRL